MAEQLQPEPEPEPEPEPAEDHPGLELLSLNHPAEAVVDCA